MYRCLSSLSACSTGCSFCFCFVSFSFQGFRVRGLSTAAALATYIKSGIGQNRCHYLGFKEWNGYADSVIQISVVPDRS
jgi:hypothetical protein